MPINLINYIKSTLDKKDLERTADLTEMEARTLLETVRPIPEYVEPVAHQKAERTKDLSIIIPAQNADKYIPKCISSIIAEVKPLGIDYEIIVVEGGSTDDTLDLLEEYGDAITLLNVDKEGAGSAKNIGLDHACGRYIMFVDADDFIMPNFIFDMWNAMVASDADILVTGYMDYENEGYHPITDIPKFAVKLDDMVSVTPFLWGKMYKAELFDDVRCPQGLYYDSMISIYLLLPKAKSVYLMDGCGYVYHKHMHMRSNTLKKTYACLDTVWTMEYCLDHMGDLFYKSPATFYRKILNHFMFISYSRIYKLDPEYREAVFVIGASILEKLEAKMSEEDLKNLDILLTGAEKAIRRAFKLRRVGVWEFMGQYGYELFRKQEKAYNNKKKEALL